MQCAKHTGRNFTGKCSRETINNKKYCEFHLEKARKSHKNAYNKSKQLGLCIDCDQPVVSKTVRCKNHYEQNKTYTRARSLELKLVAFNKYGGPKCNCCGETIISGLTIDHINNDGYLFRKTGEHVIYRWLRNNNYPSGFQVLCSTCNLSKHLNNGTCEHQMIKVLRVVHK